MNRPSHEQFMQQRRAELGQVATQHEIWPPTEASGRRRGCKSIDFGKLEPWWFGLNSAKPSLASSPRHSARLLAPTQLARQLAMGSPGLRGLTQLALVAALVAACAGQASLNTYAVDWTAVPIASTQPKDLTSDCICDVTLNACDPSCCCDADCPYSVTNVTATEGRCLPEGPPDQTLDFCVPSSSVQKV